MEENKEEFEELLMELHSRFFHVMSEDKDVDGVKIEEIILIDFLKDNKKALSFKPLSWFVEEFMGMCYSKAIKN